MQKRNYQYIARLSRVLAGTNEENYPDDDLIQDMNTIRQDIFERIVSRGKSNPYWDEATINTEAEENEYPLPGPDDDKEPDDRYFAGMRSVKKVFVKYTEDGSYEELPYAEISNPLGENQYKKHYSIADNSLFIFPAPKISIEDGIIVHGVNTLRDVEINANEAKIWGNRLPSKAFEILALGMAMYYVKYRKRDFAEAEKLEAEYEKEINRLVQTMKARSVRIIENESAPIRTDLQ